MEHLKLKLDLYEDVKIMHDAILYLKGMVETVEAEVMERDKGKVASELFIRVNRMKEEMGKMESESERVLRVADIEHYGPLSKFARPYLGF